MFAREGYSIIISVAILSVALLLLGVWLGAPWSGFLYLLALAAIGFTLYFFRDPKRTPPPEAASGNLLLSPADGRVVLVEDVAHEPLYIKGPARQVSIFLSPLNVHVNRAPATGVIEFDQYVAGDYLVAWHPKASEKNERSQLGLLHPSGHRVLFKQIAGAVARRIVYHIGVGDRVHAGQRFGIVKFGSRMDVLVPPSVQINAKVGDIVQAGVTIIGRFPERLTDVNAPEETEPLAVELA